MKKNVSLKDNLKGGLISEVSFTTRHKEIANVNFFTNIKNRIYFVVFKNDVSELQSAYEKTIYSKP